MMAGRGETTARPAAPVMNLVTANKGFNRFTWGVQHQNGFGAPPGEYTVKVSLGSEPARRCRSPC